MNNNITTVCICMMLALIIVPDPTQTARFIRITQAGANAKYHWSIYGFDVYRRS